MPTASCCRSSVSTASGCRFPHQLLSSPREYLHERNYHIIIPPDTMPWVLNQTPRRPKVNAEAKPRRLPSVAFIYSLIIAILLLLFSGAESISGFMTKPFRSDEAVGGFLEIATFTLPFAVAAWFLWIKPENRRRDSCDCRACNHNLDDGRMESPGNG